MKSLLMSEFQKEFDRLSKNSNNQLLLDLRGSILHAFHEGLLAVDPSKLINSSVKWKNPEDENSKILNIFGFTGRNTINFSLDLGKYSSILVVGGGKATAPMASAILQIISQRMNCSGTINIPHGQDWGNYIQNADGDSSSKIEIRYAGHPIPDEAGFLGCQKIIESIENAEKDVLVLVLISGGGSSLMPLPKSGLTLEDLQKVNKQLLACGAEINEINTIRKHLSAFKGGNLTKAIFPRHSIAFIISDVIGNPLDVIASGPTVPDSSTFIDAMQIIKKYAIAEQLPKSVMDIIKQGLNQEIPDNPKDGDKVFSANTNLIIGSAEVAKNQIVSFLKSKNAEVLSQYFKDIDLPQMFGEAKEYGVKLANILSEIDKRYAEMRNVKQTEKQEDTLSFEKLAQKSLFLINTGEFTVTIKGKGKGGRNQEMLLGCLSDLRNKQFENIDFVVVSMAFDGIEGNSPAAGGVIDSEALTKIETMGLLPDIAKSLENNDSYNLFNSLKDAIETGQTQTNINDICAVIVRAKKKE